MNNPEDMVIYISVFLAVVVVVFCFAYFKRKEKKRIERAKSFCRELGIEPTEEKIKRMTYREPLGGDYSGGDGGWSDAGGGDGD